MLLIVGCDSTESASGPAPTVTGVVFQDTGNEGDGSDVRVSFTRPLPEDGISEYRVVIVKVTAAAGFDLASAEAVDASRFHTLAAGGSTEITLGASATDTDGDAIAEGVGYSAFVLTIADGVDAATNSLSTASAASTLEQEVYVGTLTGAIQIGSGGMAVDLQGNVYAADFGATLSGGGQTVRRITPQGEVSTFATGLNGASGNAFDSQGNLMQSNITGGFVSRISPSGAATTFVSSGISGPVGIAIDNADNLYVANCGNQTIQFVTSTGMSSQFSSGALFGCPNGIALADDGNLYVANFNNGSIIKVAPDGTPSLFATVPGNNNGHITHANGVLYVVGRGANRIYQLTLDGALSVIAGSGTRGHDDGRPLEASFSLPNDLAASPDGSLLYVNEVSPTSGTGISPTIIRVIKLPKQVAVSSGQ